MAAKILLFTIVACFACACVQMPSGERPRPASGAKILDCKGASCDVKVSVKCEAYIFCRIEADYDWVTVSPGNSPIIRWEIVTPGYVFWDNGIAFPAGSPFDCHRDGKTKYECKDAHREPGTYKYTITVIGFPFVFPKDPWIDNL